MRRESLQFLRVGSSAAMRCELRIAPADPASLGDGSAPTAWFDSSCFDATMGAVRDRLAVLIKVGALSIVLRAHPEHPRPCTRVCLHLFCRTC
eukprot:m.19341 g.19341  ORF g.19341 m.19341 type:complete len:93 (+) comp3733_c0_seq2:72-350(+)